LTGLPDPISSSNRRPRQTNSNTNRDGTNAIHARAVAARNSRSVPILTRGLRSSLTSVVQTLLQRLEETEFPPARRDRDEGGDDALWVMEDELVHGYRSL
jgi:hypothetical protein